MSHVGLIFEKQWLHALMLAVLIFGLVFACDIDRLQAGQFLGVKSLTWLWISVAVAVAHQLLVWFCWRTQLHLFLLSRLMGSHGFTVYAVFFSILGIARVISIIVLALSNRDTIALDQTSLRILALVMAGPALYLFYSVKRFFGFKRAFGVDHFDESYRFMPFVRKGIFRFTSNGMYLFGFLLLWLPGLWYASASALSAALFSHIYIWVHYYATELPDIKRIYGVS